MQKIGIFIKQNNGDIKIEISFEIIERKAPGGTVYLSWYDAFDLLGGCLQLALYPWLRRRRLHVESAIPEEMKPRQAHKIMVIQWLWI